MDEKKYTTMELAEQLGVPRTTINDWLNRYSQYIDTVAQGKRKVYPESALNVLREIAAFRNAGKAFADIESELSAKHPIRAVPVPPQEEQKTTQAGPGKAVGGTGTEAAAGNPSGGKEEFAVIARQQSEEIGRLIGESFRNMEKRIQTLENLSAFQRRMSGIWLIVGLLFLAVLAGGGFLAWRIMSSTQKENIRLRRQQQENTARLTALKEQSASLMAGSKMFQTNIARLESELQRQKNEFSQALREENQRLAELHRAREKALLSERDQALMQVKERETRLALEKEKFASERLKLLKELETLKKQQDARMKGKEEIPVGPEKQAGKNVPAPSPAPVRAAEPDQKANSENTVRRQPGERGAL